MNVPDLQFTPSMLEATGAVQAMAIATRSHLGLGALSNFDYPRCDGKCWPYCGVYSDWPRRRCQKL